MKITLTPDMERTLIEQARKLGITPEQLVLDSLKERLASASFTGSKKKLLSYERADQQISL